MFGCLINITLFQNDQLYFVVVFVGMSSKLHPRMSWVLAQPVNRSPSVLSQVSGEEMLNEFIMNTLCVQNMCKSLS